MMTIKIGQSYVLQEEPNKGRILKIYEIFTEQKCINSIRKNTMLHFKK